MRAYSFQNTVTLVNGVELVGFADGDDVISIKRRTDAASDKIGAGGEMMVSISADKSGEVTFKLLQTSGSNKYLQNILDLQEASGSAFVPARFLFKDTYRNDLATGTVGYLKKAAEVQRGEKGNTQEWTLVCERLDLAFGDVALA